MEEWPEAQPQRRGPQERPSGTSQSPQTPTPKRRQGSQLGVSSLLTPPSGSLPVAHMGPENSSREPGCPSPLLLCIPGSVGSPTSMPSPSSAFCQFWQSKAPLVPAAQPRHSLRAAGPRSPGSSPQPCPCLLAWEPRARQASRSGAAIDLGTHSFPSVVWKIPHTFTGGLTVEERTL